MKRRPSWEHGSIGGYTNHKCRCDKCTQAWAEYVLRSKKRRTSAPTPNHVHGTDNGYCNYGCRCRLCTDAHNVWSNNYNAKRRSMS